MQDTNKEDQETLKDALALALTKANEGILEYVKISSISYEHMAQYEKEEMQARAMMVVNALATYYKMDVETLLHLLERHKGE